MNQVKEKPRAQEKINILKQRILEKKQLIAEKRAIKEE